MRRRIEDAHDELEALGDGGRQKTTHVYTGESLLEVVLSDNAYKYRNDLSLVSGSSIRGEHKVSKPPHFKDDNQRDSPLTNLYYFYKFNSDMRCKTYSSD